MCCPKANIRYFCWHELLMYLIDVVSAQCPLCFNFQVNIYVTFHWVAMLCDWRMIILRPLKTYFYYSVSVGNVPILMIMFFSVNCHISLLFSPLLIPPMCISQNCQTERSALWRSSDDWSLGLHQSRGILHLTQAPPQRILTVCSFTAVNPDAVPSLSECEFQVAQKYIMLYIK